jgi:modification methylase accI
MKDKFCTYYTNSNEITSYMIGQLDLKKGDIILEPSAGEGAFIDRIIKEVSDIKIDALDINKASINILNQKYSHLKNINIRYADTLLDKELDKVADIRLLKHTNTLLYNELNFIQKNYGFYDKIIGNPPYGAWQDYEKREVLKKKYSGHYVKETYSLFLLRALSLLKIDGRLCFIIPDTFLFLKMHSKLRKILLTKSSIHEILIFPSKFFPGINFGYSNLSIITLKRTNEMQSLDNNIRIIKGFRNIDDLNQISNGKLSNHLQVFHLKQKTILDTEDSKFILTDINNKELIINSKYKKLGEIAKVVTGFYCGDNRLFIRRTRNSHRKIKGYETVDDKKIHISSSTEGIPNIEEAYIPYIKGSSKTSYVRDDNDWLIRWDKKTVDKYKTNPKARFQNPTFYFKQGIAIPMVKSKQIKGTLLNNLLFDQSIVGIFPNDKRLLYFFLALFNSKTISNLIHAINPTANNSANYIKQLPIIIPEEKKILEISKMVQKVIEYKLTGNLDFQDYETKINKIIEEIYSSSM